MNPDPTDRTRTADPTARDQDPPLPPANDPGGTHAKGYSADPDPNAPVVPDPIPVADAPPGGIRIPERDSPGAQPTGRKEPGPYNPNDRFTSGGR
jgi:hypothetical protein